MTPRSPFFQDLLGVWVWGHFRRVGALAHGASGDLSVFSVRRDARVWSVLEILGRIEEHLAVSGAS